MRVTTLKSITSVIFMKIIKPNNEEKTVGAQRKQMMEIIAG